MPRLARSYSALNITTTIDGTTARIHARGGDRPRDPAPAARGGCRTAAAGDRPVVGPDRHVVHGRRRPAPAVRPHGQQLGLPHDGDRTGAAAAVVAGQALGEVYFRDGGRHAHGLDDSAIIEQMEFDL